MNRSQSQHFSNRLLTPIQYVKGVGPKLLNSLSGRVYSPSRMPFIFSRGVTKTEEAWKRSLNLKPGERRRDLVKSCSLELLFIKISGKEFLKLSWEMERNDHIEVVSWKREIPQGTI